MLIALQFYESGTFLQVIGDAIGVDKSTVSRAVQNTSQLLSAKQKASTKWPTTVVTIRENKNDFYQRRRFPGVISFINGMHVHIIASSTDERDFDNRKGFHLINAQAVCNHKGKFAVA